MKCPSRSASAARNSARISSSVMSAVALKPGRGRLQPRIADRALEGLQTHAYRGSKPGGATLLLPIPATSTGVKMRLTGWAIALAAAGLTPAAVHGQAGAPAPAAT